MLRAITRPSGSRYLRASLVLLAFSLCAFRAHAETLTITSSPPGAAIEISGKLAGTTPYKTDYPGAYFHKTHSVFTGRLDHSMMVKVFKEGYLPEQITLTNGPFEWVAMNGRHHREYFLLKSDHFDIKLDPISDGNGSGDSIGGGLNRYFGNAGPIKPAMAGSSPQTGQVPSSLNTSTETPRSERSESRVETGSVSIASDPPDAEIYIDGKFVGQTPATIPLRMGVHHIELKADGKQTWMRDLDVPTGSQLTLHPMLAPFPHPDIGPPKENH